LGTETIKAVWLVLDGTTLYVDRNGNGDLTEAGDKVEADAHPGEDSDVRHFAAGDIRAGPRTHKALTVVVGGLDRLAAGDGLAKAFLARNPTARAYSISAELEVPGWKGAGVGGRVLQAAPGIDVNGVLQFTDRPGDAPVIHFGAPLQVTLYGQQVLTRDRETDVFVGLATPGLGPGTSAYVSYENILPETAFPTLDVTYPVARPGEPPVRQRYELKQRC
jgi:hypothetical protein